MKLFELFTENKTREPGEFVYHATLPKNLPNIAVQGLKPNRGYMGDGVYFAYKPNEGYYHISAREAVVLRTAWLELVKLFGKYSTDNPSGIQRDDDQILVPGIVPANLIEVYRDGEWVSLEGYKQY